MKRKFFLIMVGSFLFLVVSASMVRSVSSCFPPLRRGSSYSSCPSQYKHANTDLKYKDYEPIPMTVSDAYKKGWEQFMRYPGTFLSTNSDSTEVAFFCPLSNGSPRRGAGKRNTSFSTRNYSRVELHSRMCPPDKYPYYEKVDGSYEQVCTGYDFVLEKPMTSTPVLSRVGIYRRLVCTHNGLTSPGCSSYLKKYAKGSTNSDLRSGIIENKYEGLCPAPKKAYCRPGHVLRFQHIVYSNDYVRSIPLDCRPYDGGSGGSGLGSGGEQENCPTVKVKVNGFPFQRIKVKRKGCS